MNWSTSNLEDICEIEMGGTPDRANPAYWEGNNVWVSIADLSGLDESVICDSHEKISDLGVKNSGVYPVAPGTLLLSFKLSIGKVAIAGTHLYTNEAIVALPIKKPHEIDVMFLYYALQATDWSNSGQRAVKGTTLNKALLSQLEISYPPLAEQRRIAAILRTADDERRRRRYTQSLSDSLLREIFVRMFGDPATNPMGWNSVPLYTVCAAIIDCPHSTPKYAEGKTAYVCVRSSDIQSGYLDLSNGQYLDSNEYKIRIERGSPQQSDIIYCREGARLGNAARVIDADPLLALGQRMMLYRVDSRLAAPEFVWSVLESESIKGQVWMLVAGSASPHANIRDLATIDIIMPPIESQQAFASKVKEHDRTRRQQQESARQSDHLFETLLHRAFGGEL